MEKNQIPLPVKSSSFSSARADKLRKPDRNLSLGTLKLEDLDKKDDLHIDQIQEETEEENAEANSDGEAAAAESQAEPDFATLTEEIDWFLAVLARPGDGETEHPDPPEIPEAVVGKFMVAVEREITKYESGDEKWTPEHDNLPLLDAVDRVSKLVSALAACSSPEPPYTNAMNRAGAVLHHAMTFLEDEFYALLHDSRSKPDGNDNGSKPKHSPSFDAQHESDRCILPTAESDSGDDSALPYPPETVHRLHTIAGAMLSAGYVTECCEVFSVARRNAFEAGLSALGYQKASIDDVVKMAWESLEGEIAMWIKAFRPTVATTFPHERDLCNGVFSGHPSIANSICRGFVCGTMVQLLTFPEAVAMTKRSTEKLFKMLDVYEALRDGVPALGSLLPAEEASDDDGAEAFSELKSDVNSIRSRIGEVAVAIFCDLESSIKSDTAKTPVPSGTVHPLTRYAMNYLKYACEYKNTLEQVFQEHHHKPSASSSNDDNDNSGGGGNNSNNNNPFAAQLMEVMDLLHSNLEGKSKLYKDPALSSIFLMNNGRYIVQKIRGSAEINALLGDTWARKRSSDLRQYHKNYQRETWGRVLACLRDEGISAKGSVQKPVLKERLKSFNALFEEIHRTQSLWVVSDEQLQSELRVSISAVVVPAYRSFLGRFSQYLTPGRQTEKYVKFAAEDLEGYIDELFDGPTSMARRRT